MEQYPVIAMATEFGLRVPLVPGMTERSRTDDAVIFERDDPPMTLAVFAEPEPGVFGVSEIIGRAVVGDDPERSMRVVQQQRGEVAGSQQVEAVEYVDDVRGRHGFLQATLLPTGVVVSVHVLHLDSSGHDRALSLEIMQGIAVVES